MMSNLSEAIDLPVARQARSEDPCADRQQSECFKREALIHLDALYGTALRLTRTPSHAEDLVQDTVLRAWQKWHQFATGTHAKAWLLRIMTHLYINQFRRQRKERAILSDPEHPKFKDRFFDANEARRNANPEAQFIKRHLSTPVQKALESLSPRYRSTVVLADLQGFSYGEIAEILQCPLGTVMSRLFRARRQLKELLKGHMDKEFNIGS